MTILSTIAFWAGMCTAVAAAYFVIHALIAVVCCVADIAKRIYWFVTDEDDLCNYPYYNDIEP
jgi:hypothetical protein